MNNYVRGSVPHARARFIIAYDELRVPERPSQTIRTIDTRDRTRLDGTTPRSRPVQARPLCGDRPSYSAGRRSGVGRVRM